MKKIILLLIVSLLLLGFKPIEKWYEPIAGKNQKTFYSNGEAILLSYQPKTVVMASLGKPKGKELLLHIGFNNVSAEPINIFPEEIMFDGVNKSDKIVQLNTYSANEYLKKFSRKQRWKNFFFGGKPAAVITSDSTTNAFGTDFDGFFNSTTTTEIHDTSSKDELIKAVDSALLRRNTLQPEKPLCGYIVADYSKKYNRKILVHVKIDSDVHNLIFKLK
jgi:hypothetical protein